MKINVPTQLTLLRLGLVPFFLIFTVVDSLSSRILALLIFVGASLTDLYDGRLARRWGQVTTLGIFLDPLADKFLISSAFVAFVQIPEIHVPAWMVVLVIGREFMITGLRALAAAEGRILPAQRAGKFKTTSQMVAIITILVVLIANSLVERYGWMPADSSTAGGTWTAIAWTLRSMPYWLMLLTTILTIASGYIYIRANADLFHGDAVKAR